LLLVTLAGCGSAEPERESTGAAALRGFAVEVEQAVAPQVPSVHLRTCGPWGCHEQDVTLLISGPMSALPCPADAAADTACSAVRLPGPGPGFGYAPVPSLTMDAVTVTVTTPDRAKFPINAEVRVTPVAVCDAAPCPDGTGTPQAKLLIAADGTVRQSG
jgi:hypothetical protein